VNRLLAVWKPGMGLCAVKLAHSVHTRV